MGNFPIYPEQASDFAVQFDLLFWFETALSIFFFVLVVAFILLFAVKYRRGSNANRVNPPHHHRVLELGMIFSLIALCLVVFVWSSRLYVNVVVAPANAAEIFIIGKQWMWHLQHSNGVRENNELHLPKGQPVKLTMISQDVVHDFAVPEFRIKKDVIPGRYTSISFTPTKVGKYHLLCDQYCGTNHSEMAGYVYVMEPQDFAKWLASGYGNQPTTQTPEKAKTMETAGAFLYEQLKCGSCHDPDMGRGPLLAGVYGQKKTLTNGKTVVADQAYLRESMLNPNDKIAAKYLTTMPSYKDQLSEDQVLQLIAYIKSLSVKPAPGVQTTGAPAAPAGNQAGTQVTMKGNQ